MCKYCDVPFTGECNEKLVELKIEVNGFRMFGAHTCIESSDKKFFINTYLTEQFGRCFASERMEIQYCHVCGRKLRKSP